MLTARNDKAKCAGQDSTGNNVCSDRNRCGRFLRPEGDNQTFEAFWMAGDRCQHYEVVSKQYHIADDWNESRIDVIGANGNDGLHYEAV